MSQWADLARLDGMAQAELCARGDVSAAELWQACWERIDRLNPLLRALVTREGERPEPGKGPFAGVPFVVKDSMPWPGLRWSLGARLFKATVSTQQTPFGLRLAEAGLTCAGKTALSEFGLLASTESLLEGATHNPWDLAHSPGGSSGGSAAAVAAGIVPLAHANDGGGSIRIPASLCGLFGFKPSRGVPVAASFGASDFAAMTSDHCLSRSVRDSALFLSVTASTMGTPMVREPSPKRLRIAAFTRTLTGAEPTPVLVHAHNNVMALLADLGHVVEPIVAPEYDGAALGDAFFVVAGAAVADVVARADARRSTPVQTDELEPFTWALIDRFRARPNAMADARAAFAQAVRAYREATRTYDVVLTPSVAREAWPIGFLSPTLDADELIRRTGTCIGYTPIHNVMGAPAMSVPLSFPENGLPIGAHFAGMPGADALLLGLAYELEQARPWKDRWPPYSIPRLG
jgi:amidase